MKKTLLIFAVLAQLFVPAWMIYSAEQVLSGGEIWRFETEPVDPYDFFRGRYVAFAIKAERVPLAGNEDFKAGEKAYALLEKDSKGFAQIRKLSRQVPAGKPYLKTKISYTPFPNFSRTSGAGEPFDSSGHPLGIELPFRRFYMNEKKAPLAEEMLRNRTSGGLTSDAYVEVRVKGGTGLIQDFYLNGRPAKEIAEKIFKKGK